MLTRRKTIMMGLLFASIVIIGVYINFLYRNVEYSFSPVAAIEKQRGKGYVSYMIRELPISSGEIAFFIKNKSNDQIQIGVDTSNCLLKDGYGKMVGTSVTLIFGGGFLTRR
ncbi:hypothetical protein [Paenibacillus pini]|nr:hypothetical protein [Paenibacillus pini]